MDDSDGLKAWITRLQDVGLAHPVGVALDALEPLGPLGAQLLWVAQPALGLFVARDTLEALGRTLEEPGGVARLRQLLDPPAPID